MQIPKESLDDFMDKGDARKRPEPPPMKRLRSTGQVEELKPLAANTGALRKSSSRFARNNPYGLSWYHRSLVTAGTIAVTALIFGTGIYLGIFGRPSNPASERDTIATRRQNERLRTPPKVMGPFELRSGQIVPNGPDEISDVQPAVIKRIARPHVVRAVYRPRHFIRHHPQLAISNFVPTTLIIYAENGKIKTRIEPQLTAAYKKPATFSN